MGKWLDSKMVKSENSTYMYLDKGIDYYRVKQAGIIYNIPRCEEADKQYDASDDIYFANKIQEMRSKKGNRKEKRKNNKFYRNYIKKLNKKNMIKEDVIKDNDSSIEDVKQEVANNLKKVLGESKEKEINDDKTE